jgi:hypothetical protein
MSNVESLKASVKICMFDQYGTVVDMQSGLTEVAAPFLRSKGWTGNANSFVTWWRRTHFENSMIDALLHKRPVLLVRADSGQSLNHDRIAKPEPHASFGAAPPDGRDG